MDVRLDHKGCVCVLTRIRLFVTQWTVACQAPLSTECSRQEYWKGLPSPTPRDLPDPGIEPHLLCFLHWQVDSLPLVTTWEAQRRLRAEELMLLNCDAEDS